MNRALLVGINNYPDPQNALRGCVNDITDMAAFLLKPMGFAKADIRLLVDDRATAQSIHYHIGWLVNGVDPGDRVVFHYSGHGAQMALRLPSGDVSVVHDAICPYDFDWTPDHAITDVDFQSLF